MFRYMLVLFSAIFLSACSQGYSNQPVGSLQAVNSLGQYNGYEGNSFQYMNHNFYIEHSFGQDRIKIDNGAKISLNMTNSQIIESGDLMSGERVIIIQGTDRNGVGPMYRIISLIPHHLHVNQVPVRSGEQLTFDYTENGVNIQTNSGRSMVYSNQHFMVPYNNVRTARSNHYTSGITPERNVISSRVSHNENYLSVNDNAPVLGMERNVSDDHISQNMDMED